MSKQIKNVSIEGQMVMLDPDSVKSSDIRSVNRHC